VVAAALVAIKSGDYAYAEDMYELERIATAIGEWDFSEESGWGKLELWQHGSVKQDSYISQQVAASDRVKTFMAQYHQFYNLPESRSEEDTTSKPRQSSIRVAIFGDHSTIVSGPCIKGEGW